MSPFDPYYRNPFDPRYNPARIRPHRPVKHIKVRRAGEAGQGEHPAEPTPPEDQQVVMKQEQDRTDPISTDQIEQRQDVDWQAQYARLQADLENTKKQLRKRYAQHSDDLRIRMLQDLLPLADHLESALMHSDDEQNDATLRQGVALTLRAFLETLAKYGVQVIDPQGEAFNPELHEAVGLIATSSVPGGHVAKVMQRGYTIDGRVIRPARVLVAQ